MPPRHYDSLETDELGAAALAEARKDIGIAESCPNWGIEVADFLKTVGIAIPAHWCAAAIHTWIIRGATAKNIVPSVLPTGMAKATMEQLKEKGRWIDRAGAALDMLWPGMLVVWDRSSPNVPTWRGHIGILESVGADGQSFTTIDGNTQLPGGGEGVARRKRLWNDPRLLGFGVLSGPMPGAEKPKSGGAEPGGATSTPYSTTIWPAIGGFAAGLSGVMLFSLISERKNKLASQR